MLYDLSPQLTSDIAVFPGDTKLSREVLMDMRDGTHVTLSTMHATSHLGSHVDGPVHYGVDGCGVGDLAIERFVGLAQVMRVDVGRNTRIGIEHLKGPIESTRLLLHTGTFPDPNNWNDDFAAIEPALVEHLSDSGVTLLGIDTPSVDLATAKVLEAHHAFLKHDIVILEGIVLNDIPPGMYELIALPLKLRDFDASPVRAVLRTID